VDAPNGLNSLRYLGVLVQGQMCPRAAVTVHIQKEHVAPVPLAEDDDVVKAFPPERAKQQIRQIADSIEWFGFANPVLISDDGEIIAGHGRVEAAKLLKIAASSISAIVKKLDGELSCFARRRLEEPFPYLILDARYEKVSQAVFIAVGIDWEGGGKSWASSFLTARAGRVGGTFLPA
jgi:hypothetical protein